MSRRLAASLPSVQSFQPPPSSGDVGWTVTLRRAARHFRIYPGGVALAILLLGLSTLIGTFGPLTGALLAAVNALVIWIALWVLRRVGQGTSRFALLLNRPLSGLAISSAAVFVAELVLLPVAGRTDHPRILLVGTMLLVPACLWTIYFARNLLVQQQEMNSTLTHTTWEVRTEIARLQTMAWSRQRTLARALHGPVQAVITAAALRLDMAKARQAVAYLDVDALREEILEVIENSGHPGDEGSLASGVSRIQLVWSRVCDVRLLVEPDCVAVLEGGETVHAALEVIQEACSNAVRHGAATQVSVAVRISKDATDSLQIDIRDNGRSTTDTSQPRGLGSEILDDVALTWHRETSHGGTLLSVLLPMVNMSGTLNEDDQAPTSGGPR